ncbi:MAG: HAMP domain-containing protein [Betaproteobacteria bacterium]|nr:HAMP domain-containing protein [Betaproteobacteria bacterium]
MTAKNPSNPWNALSIRARLSIGYAATLSLLLFIYAILVYLAVRERFLAEIDHRLDQEVEIAERSLTRGVSGELLWRPLHEGTVNYQPLANILWIDIHRADGTPVKLSLGGYARGVTPEPLPFSPRPSGFFTTRLPSGIPLRILQVEVDVAGERAIIRAAYAEEQLEHELASLLWVLALGLPLTVGAAALAGFWLAGRALAPVAKMAGEARAITAERLDARLPVINANDELGWLATTFNDLFSRLERSFEQLRRFTSDASHELRTPLAVIRSVGEVGLREPHSGDEYRNIIAVMLEETDRLALLTTLLLELTRAESGRTTVKRTPFDLRDLIGDAAGFISVLAEEARVLLELDLPDTPLPVTGDRTMLRHALVNLLDNAIKHSPPDTVVSLACRVQAGGMEIAVADHGDGIPAEQLPRIFDRFYRVDAARNRERGGFGLGLAIARWAVEAHGGRIDAESEPGKGSVFRMVLPRPAAPAAVPNPTVQPHPTQFQTQRPHEEKRHDPPPSRCGAFFPAGRHPGRRGQARICRWPCHRRTL